MYEPGVPGRGVLCLRVVYVVFMKCVKGITKLKGEREKENSINIATHTANSHDTIVKPIVFLRERLKTANMIPASKLGPVTADFTLDGPLPPCHAFEQSTHGYFG